MTDDLRGGRVESRGADIRIRGLGCQYVLIDSSPRKLSYPSQ